MVFLHVLDLVGPSSGSSEGMNLFLPKFCFFFFNQSRWRPWLPPVLVSVALSEPCIWLETCSGAHSGILTLQQVLKAHLQLQLKEPGGPDAEQDLRGAAAGHVPAQRRPQDRHRHGPRHPEDLRQCLLQEPPARVGPLLLRSGPPYRHPFPPHCQRLGPELRSLRTGLRHRHDQARPRRRQDWVAGEHQNPVRYPRLGAGPSPEGVCGRPWMGFLPMASFSHSLHTLPLTPFRLVLARPAGQ